MAKAYEAFTVESLLDEVEQLIGDRFVVTGERKEMRLTLPTYPYKEFSAKGRKRIVAYLQGMVWAGSRRNR